MSPGQGVEPTGRREALASVLADLYPGQILWAEVDAIIEQVDASRSEPHCPTCICGKRAPVQGEYHGTRRGAKPSGTVTWAEHLEAYTAYAAQYGQSQSAERLAERAGFGYWEITDLLGHEPTTWTVRGGR